MNMVSASLYREYKNRLTSARVFIENIVNPLLTLFIFGIALGKAVGHISLFGKKVSYLSFFVVGAINMSLVSNAMVSSTKIFVDKYVGLFEEMLTYPGKRSNILLGKMIFNAILSLLQGLVMFVFIYIIEPKSFVIGINTFIFFVLIVFGSFGWFSFLTYLSLLVNTQDSFNSIYYLVMTPLIFISSVYYPVESMPLIVKQLSNINPLTWLTDINRYFLLNIDVPCFYIKMLAFIIFTLIFYILTKNKFEKEP